MPVLRRWESDESNGRNGLQRYDPTSSEQNGSDSAASATDGETDSDTSDAGHAKVDLTIERLQSLHNSMTTKNTEMSEFATRGSSKERVVEALRNPRCECKNRCRVPLRTLLKVVVAFWMLTKPTQDSLLWSLQHEAGSNKRKEWCKVAFRGTDLRTMSCPGGAQLSLPFTLPHSGQSAPPAIKTASVRAFMIHMYFTASEPMPTSIASKSVINGADDELRQELLDRLVDSRLVGPTCQISCNHDPNRLPMRELPHGSWMNMYLLYRAWMKSNDEHHDSPASRSTFFNVIQEWKVCIKFHRRTHHQICLTCSTLRSAILKTADFQEISRLSDQLLSHYCETYADRQVYYAARQRSRSQSDLLVMILDSFDKCKLVLPRWRFGRTPKRPIYEATHRTSLTLTGTIVHGYGVYIYIADEGMATGASWTIEVAMRSIDRAWQQARARNQPFPWELWLQGDNCPKEVRNSFTGKWLCLLAQANYFVGGSHHHMVVGHTHEDIDGVFSLITSCLNSESIIETPRDIQRTILRKLTPNFAKKGLALEVELVDTIRDWAALMPANATMRNCYRSRKTDGANNMRVPQSFSFFPREAMPAGGVGLAKDERVPPRLRSQGNGRDVFAMIKGNMSDASLIQPPLLVWPESLVGDVERFWNNINSTQQVLHSMLDDTRVDELRLLADQIEADYPHMSRAVQYYRSLMDHRRPRKPYEQLCFVEAGPQAAARVGQVQLGERPPPPRHHKLEVVFHHGRG
ncbi:unnamed protein product [Cladocopium goreaui]|uniref:DUF7869 domain-containing protein n=1 Tax=Cladocopium goreaui TaxID=2562237 RepID=A0A9P1GT75_9DINO|nr:unnamed protein product [Cladocopium goreaui]